MSETTFTAGPWAVASGCKQYVHADGLWIASTMGVKGEQGEANAALIASAPRMYEALRQLVGNAEIAKAHLPNTDEAHIVSSALFDTICQANEVLARARGEQP